MSTITEESILLDFNNELSPDRKKKDPPLHLVDEKVYKSKSFYKKELNKSLKPPEEIEHQESADEKNYLEEHKDPGDDITKKQVFKDNQYALPEMQRESYIQEFSAAVDRELSLGEEQAIYEVIAKVTADVVRNVRYIEPMYLDAPISKIKEESDNTNNKEEKKYQWFQKKLGVTQIINGRHYTLPTPDTIPEDWKYKNRPDKTSAQDWITKYSGLRKFLTKGGAADDVLFQDQLQLLDVDGHKQLKSALGGTLKDIVAPKTVREKSEAKRLLEKFEGLETAHDAHRIVNTEYSRKTKG